MRLIYIFFGSSVAESREARKIFMHIINILCIKYKKRCLPFLQAANRNRNFSDCVRHSLKVVKISNTFNFSFCRGSRNMNI